MSLSRNIWLRSPSSRRGGSGAELGGDACVALAGIAVLACGTLASPLLELLLSPRFVKESLAAHLEQQPRRFLEHQSAYHSKMDGQNDHLLPALDSRR